MKQLPYYTIILLALLHPMKTISSENMAGENTKPERIVNLINFIRQSEPRDSAITEDVLVETVRQQILLYKKYNMPGTFLLQYDALINPRYQQLLKDSIPPNSLIGAWWEITQPHAEAAGLKWRGRYE